MITVIFHIEQDAADHVKIENPVFDQKATPTEMALAKRICAAGIDAATKGQRTVRMQFSGGASAQEVAELVRGFQEGGQG